MSSFIYFYSKFTEEFLFLTGSVIFALLATYCYHWVVNRRRLGSSSKLVPAGVVKEYLNQLIGEAQFVRTQLFGLLSGGPSNLDSATMESMLKGAVTGASTESGSHHTGTSTGIPSELLARLQTLETQLAEKEGLIVNVNVEKTKLLQDLEVLKEKQKSAPAAGATGNQDDLLKRLKMLEQQLEEYSLFEDDLANIKRIQQENDSLKKRIEELSQGKTVAPAASAAVAAAPSLSIVPDLKPEPAIDSEPSILAHPSVHIEPAPKSVTLDAASIEALLDGESPVPPATKVAPTPEPAINFDDLASSVETSMTAPTPEPLAVAPTPEPLVAAVAPASAPEPVAASNEMSKSDEELLKEFENLLNSG